MSALREPAELLADHDVVAATDDRLASHSAGASEDAPTAVRAGDWLRVPAGAPMRRSQGWKLHLSADVTSAGDVLRRALPLLLAERAPFKVAASLEVLRMLNDGHAGLAQVGKFLTVYPPDDERAVALAAWLVAALAGLSGPAIASDRRIGASVVHYRYGAFDGAWLQTPRGELVPALRGPDGGLVPDKRLPAFLPPAWVTDPFAGQETAAARSAPRVLAGRFAIVSDLHRSPRGSVMVAIDLERLSTVIVKHARHDAPVARDGRSAHERLYHEHAVLRTLGPSTRVPEPLALIDQAGDHYLVLPDLGGATLASQIAELTSAGVLDREQQVISWGREIAGLLRAIHASGFAHEDVTARNVLVADDGALSLVDFELARHFGAGGSGQGTRGSMSPQQVAGEPGGVADDVFALGALLYFAATGADPAAAPRPDVLCTRPVRLLNPYIGHALATVIERCLAPDPADRPATMDALDAALQAAGRVRSRASSDVGPDPGGAAHERLPALVDALRRGLRRHLERPGATTPHPLAQGAPARDVNLGLAGIVLCFADLAAVSGNADDHSALRRSARALAESSPFEPSPLPGLYVGEAGIAAALLAAGQVLGDQRVVAAALDRAAWVAGQPHASPDLFGGSAGRLRVHLMLDAATGGSSQLDAALRCGEALIDAAAAGPEGWFIPDGYEGLSGPAWLGMAHGIAGIADALLELEAVAPDARVRSAVAAACRTLLACAVRTLPDGSGLDWPERPGGTLRGPFWCHGAAGIGGFLARAAAAGYGTDVAAAARAAARTVALAGRWSSACLCHGLAGGIELLLDVSQELREPAWLADAYALAQVIETHALPNAGPLAVPGDVPRVLNPDYMVGYGGVAHCLLRLTEPARCPRLLSVQSVRYRADGIRSRLARQSRSATCAPRSAGPATTVTNGVAGPDHSAATLPSSCG